MQRALLLSQSAALVVATAAAWVAAVRVTGCSVVDGASRRATRVLGACRARTTFCARSLGPMTARHLLPSATDTTKTDSARRHHGTATETIADTDTE